MGRDIFSRPLDIVVERVERAARAGGVSPCLIAISRGGSRTMAAPLPG